jgi:chorismate-pyruvate lyase
MTTLTTTPVAPLLERLFVEADTLSPTSNLSAAERTRLMQSKTE